jgi:hypothetical protein
MNSRRLIVSPYYSITSLASSRSMATILKGRPVHGPQNGFRRAWGTMATGRERMAATRARRRRGLRKLSVEVHEDELRAIALKGYEGAATLDQLEQKPKSQEVVKGPLQIIISIADQKISVYDDGALIARSSVSTGVQGHPTPLGVFSVIGKELWHRSNIYSAAPMPYMQRITWSGIALHAGALPGRPASHGCIRLAKDFAIRLWHLTKRGTRVIIAPNNVDPVQIANPRVFSKPKTASSSQESSTDALASKDTLSIPSTPAGLVPNVEACPGPADCVEDVKQIAGRAS